mmetsp:Transcript_6460/g.7386  ORF Transcript_6460/g.7386 Transcript_6460/m.7386 type:complete len:364 (+) Transcript_6460:167-1258(+)
MLAGRPEKMVDSRGLRRLKAFLVSNGAVVLVALFEYSILQKFPAFDLPTNSSNDAYLTRLYNYIGNESAEDLLVRFGPVYISTLVRIVFFLCLITASTWNKEDIKVGKERTQERSKYPNSLQNVEILCLIMLFLVPLEVVHIGFMRAFGVERSLESYNVTVDSCIGEEMRGRNGVGALDVIDVWMMESSLVLLEKTSYWIMMFVLKSFLLEIVFDLFHYCVHRLLHENKVLYRSVHRHHHKYLHPTPLTTYCQNPLEIILSNTLPLFMTMVLSPFTLNHLESHLFMAYKTFVEIAGHAGIETNSTSFPQANILPKLFNIQLRTNDHDLHHTRIHQPCNYAKRFTLWDKVFQTYYTDKRIHKSD